MSKAKRELRRRLAREQQMIEARLEAAVAPNAGGPVLGRARVRYELAGRSRAVAHGGMGMIARLVEGVGLAAEIDEGVSDGLCKGDPPSRSQGLKALG